MELYEELDLGESAELLIKKYKNNPIAFIKDVLGIDLWEKQDDICKSVTDNAYTTVRSCYGSGKSFVAASIALWYLYTHIPSKVIITSSSYTQVEKILMAEIAKAWRNAKIPLGGSINTEGLKLSDDWFLLAISPKVEVKDDIAVRGEGFHSPNVLIVLDQAQGVHAKIWGTVTALVTGDSSRLLALGNPGSSTGKFYNACTNKKLWNEIIISAFDTPNVKAGKEVIPGLISKRWIKDREDEWGIENPLYKTKVKAEFLKESDDILFPLEFVESSVNRDIMDTGATGLGVDVARKGINNTVLTVMKGKKMIDHLSYNGRDTMKTTGHTMRMMEKHNIPAYAVCIDDTGVGGGVTDRLHENGFKVNGINNGGAADDPDHFANIGTEILWMLKKLFETENISIMNIPSLISQLPGRKYSTRSVGKGQIIAESKTEMTARGLKSPDDVDSLALAVKGQSLFVKGIEDDGPSLTCLDDEDD